MSIDWFTVSAQIVNFLILMALLKRFLYAPLLAAMDKREQTVAQRWEEAERLQQQAQIALEDNQKQQRLLRETQESALLRIREEAEAQKQQMLQTIRDDLQQRKDRWLRSIEQEKQDFLLDLQQRVGEETLAIATHALRDLAHAEIEQAITSAFLQKLTTLDPATQAALKRALHESTEALTVHTRFPLSDAQQQAILTQIEQIADAPVRVEFAQDPALLGGISLKVPPYEIAWNLREYLDALGATFQHALSARSSQAPTPPEKGAI
ncbi:F0F1 ATP synthase subunit delta [Myxococcota bacterium]|nr:F0F1 ATP synthase subunit delta [Myxococcota bacterium]